MLTGVSKLALSLSLTHTHTHTYRSVGQLLSLFSACCGHTTGMVLSDSLYLCSMSLFLSLYFLVLSQSDFPLRAECTNAEQSRWTDRQADRQTGVVSWCLTGVLGVNVTHLLSN